MNFSANKTTVEEISKKTPLEKHILETFILVLMDSGTESHSEPFLSVQISSYLCSYLWDDRSEMGFLREQLF